MIDDNVKSFRGISGPKRVMTPSSRPQVRTSRRWMAARGDHPHRLHIYWHENTEISLQLLGQCGRFIL